MLDIKFIRANPDLVKETIRNKNISLDLDALLKLDREAAVLRQEMQGYAERKNILSDSIKKASADGRPALIAESKEIGAKMDELTPRLNPLEEELALMMGLTPTIPAKDTPIGKSDADNVVVKTVGEPPVFDFKPLEHFEIMEKNGWGEFKRVPNVCGSRTAGVKGELARLEMAFWLYALDVIAESGFTPISVPSIAFEQAFFNTGHFPFDRESVYSIPKDNLFLAGTAEVVLNSLHSGEILKEQDLPILYAGFSPCYRREAGSAGKDVKGLFRVHQFSKIEQYVICKNDVAESDKWHEFIRANAEKILQGLELPYRVVACCTGDMGAGKYRMHDIEAWCPLQERYRETHSCSSLLDWQARRTNIRYRDNATGKVEYAYTLNNTGLATPRIFVPFLENHQQKDGSVRLPEAIRPYMGGRASIGGEK